MKITTFAIFVLVLAQATAAVRTWDGGDIINTSWNDATNWASNLVPVAGDTLVFPAILSAADKATNNNFAAGTDFAGLAFTASGYTVSGNSFDLLSGGIALSYATGTTTITPTIVLTGAGQTFDTGIDKPQLTTGALNLNGNSLALDGLGTVEIGGNIVNSIGTPTITKLGTGNAVLGGFNNFQGNLNIGNGTLYANGFFAGTGTIIVGTNGTFAGTNGGIAKTTTVTGTVAPGTLADITTTLEFDTLNFAAGAGTKSLDLDIRGTVAGDTYDRVTITSGGAITLNSATLALDFGSFIPPIGTSFTLINHVGAAGSINGIFSGIIQNSSAVNGGQLLRFTYTGGTGNDFTATVLNRAPIANNQSVGTNEDTAVPITLTASDANGQAVTYSILSNPSNGLIGGSGASWTYTPNANFNGTDSFTFRASDGTLSSNTATITITVNPVNDVPALASISNPAAFNEDAGLRTQSLSGIGTGASNEIQTLAITATSNNPELIPDPVVAYTSPSTVGSLAYTPVANANGSAVITVTVNDGQSSNNIVTRTFTVTVNPVNDTPTLDAIGDPIAIAEDSGQQTVNLTGIGPGAANETQILTITASSNNPLVIPNPTVVYSSANPTGSLTYTPVANAHGSAIISVVVNDGEGGTILRTFTATVTPTNDLPSFTRGADLSIDEDAGAQTVVGWATAISDGDSGVTQALTFNVTNDNNALFSSQPAISSSGILAFTPATNAHGPSTVRVSLTDDTAAGGAARTTSLQTFIITINPVNDLPVAIGQNVSTDEETPVLVTFSGTDVEGEALSYNITGNPAKGDLSGSGSSRTYTPRLNATGTDSFTFSAVDGTAGGPTATINITILPINDPPTISVVADQSIVEDTFPPGINVTVSDPDNFVSDLLLTSSSTNPSLANISPNNSGANRTVSVFPIQNQFGSATITLTISDGQASATEEFLLTVAARNDVPVFTAGADVVIAEDAGPQTITGWATGISPGAANENDQTVEFEITNNSNPSLFSAPPAIGPDGTLTFTPVPNGNGTAQFLVRLRDNGSTAFAGEQNTSNFQVFNITVNAVNDPPIAVSATENVTVNTPRSITLSASDQENQPITYFIVSSPAHGTLTTPASSVITYLPANGYTGPDTFSFKVNDGDADSNVATVDLVVTPPASRIWDGGGSDDNWTTPANWDGDIVPVEGSSAFFPSNSARPLNVNNLPQDFPFDLITLDGGNQSVGTKLPDIGNRISLRTGVLATGVMPILGAVLNVPARLLGPVTIANESTGLNGLLQLSRDITTDGHEIRLEDRSTDIPDSTGILITGRITGAGKVVVDGPGKVAIGSFQSWTGGTLVRQGTLEATGAFSVRSPLTVGDTGSTAKVVLLGSGGLDGGDLTLREGATLTAADSLNIHDLNIEHSTAVLSGDFRFSGNKTVFVSGDLNFSGAGIIAIPTVFSTATDHNINVQAGITAVMDGSVSSSSGARMVKTGSGTLKLRNTVPSDPSSGTILTREGLLLLSHDQRFLSVVMDGGELAGDFTEVVKVAGITALSGGTLTIGELNSVQGGRTKILEVGGGFSLNSQSTLRMPLDSNFSAPGFNNNKTGVVDVTGAVNLGGATLELLPLSGFLPVAGQKFVLIENDGVDPITGTFAGITEGQSVQLGSIAFRCSYVGGDGNDFAITVEVLPSGITRVWDGEGNNGTWSNPQNWSGDTVPGSGDNIEIPDGALRTSSTMDLPEGITFNHLQISAPNHNMGGVRFTLTGGITRTSTTSGLVSLPSVFLIGNHPVTTNGPGQLIFNSTLKTSQIQVSVGAGGNVLMAATSTIPVTIRKTGVGALTFQHQNTEFSIPPVALFHEAGNLTCNQNTGTITVGGQGSPATLRIPALGGPPVMEVNSQVTLLAGGVLTADAGLEFALRKLVFAGGIVDATLPFSSFAAMRIRQSIEVTVPGVWTFPRQVMLAEGTGGSVGIAVAAGATLQFNGSLATDPLGSFAVKSGPGTVRLAANERFSPLLRMDLTDGVLHSAASTPSLTPRLLGGTLAGTGTVGNVTSLSGGTVSPGASAGVLSSKNLSWNATTAFVAEIGGLTPGSGYDQLAVTGSVSLGGTALQLQLINSFLPASGASFTLIENDGVDAVSGTFAGLPEAFVFPAAGVEWSITYQGGSGNDVVVTRHAVQTAIEIWRQSNFGITSNSGDAANDFDFDKDGLANLIEFAFNLDPKSNSSHQIPQAQRAGNDLVITFTPPPGVSGITYGAEASDTLAATDWEPVSNTGTSPQLEFRMVIGPQKTRFIRLRVSED